MIKRIRKLKVFSIEIPWLLLSTNGCLHHIQYHQGSPIWGAVKKETLFTAKQLNCDLARLWKQHTVEQLQGQAVLGPDPSPPRLLCSAPCRSALCCTGLLCFVTACFILLWLDIFGGSAQSGMIHSLHSSLERENALSESGRELAYMGRSPCLKSPITPSLHKWGLQHPSLVQKALSWLVRIDLFWLVSEEVDGDRAVQLWS